MIECCVCACCCKPTASSVPLPSVEFPLQISLQVSPGNAFPPLFSLLFFSSVFCLTFLKQWVLIALRSEAEFLSVEWPTSLVGKGWFKALKNHNSPTYPLASWQCRAPGLLPFPCVLLRDRWQEQHQFRTFPYVPASPRTCVKLP